MKRPSIGWPSVAMASWKSFGEIIEHSIYFATVTFVKSSWSRNLASMRWHSSISVAPNMVHNAGTNSSWKIGLQGISNSYHCVTRKQTVFESTNSSAPWTPFKWRILVNIRKYFWCDQNACKYFEIDLTKFSVFTFIDHTYENHLRLSSCQRHDMKKSLLFWEG